MDQFINGLVNTIKKKYIILDNDTLNKSLLSLFINYKENQNLEVIKQELQKILLTLNLKNKANILPSNIPNQVDNLTKRGIDNSERIYNMLNGFTPKKILDFGGGNGEIVKALAYKLQLNKEDVFIVDNKIHEIENVSILTYENMLKLQEGSMDLIIMFEVLHHIDSNNRIEILKQISRLLSPNGVLIIKEHDDEGTEDFKIFLDLIHIFWYITEKEEDDLLNLMTRYETYNLMESVGLFSNKYETFNFYNNPQQIYFEKYTKNKFRYMFKNNDVKNGMNDFIYMLNKSPNIKEILPDRFIKYLNLYQPELTFDNNDDKKDIIKEYIKYILVDYMKHSKIINNVWELNIYNP